MAIGELPKTISHHLFIPGRSKDREVTRSAQIDLAVLL